MKTEVKSAFDETLQKFVTFYTTDRIDYDFEDGQQLEPIMCDYHLVGIHESNEEAQDAAIRYTAQFNCKHCNGTGRVYWNDSEYRCAHNG